MKDLVENNEKFIKGTKFAIYGACNLKKLLNKWKIKKKDYDKQGYKFMSRENIYKSAVKILNNKFSN